ncbi:copper resistance protein CopC [Rhizobium etli]|uniref:copper resistance protein CopC n=1 Tax=Rhizobium etli TaxID=29449 RepID=UPI001FD921A5|nr:copper resistance protein CopC [Rhizobium etli]
MKEGISQITWSAANGDSGASRKLDAGTSGADVRLRFSDLDIRGTVIVSYRVESEDGHPVGGALVFNVGAPSAGLPLRPASRPVFLCRLPSGSCTRPRFCSSHLSSAVRFSTR